MFTGASVIAYRDIRAMVAPFTLTRPHVIFERITQAMQPPTAQPCVREPLIFTEKRFTPFTSCSAHTVWHQCTCASPSVRTVQLTYAPDSATLLMSTPCSLAMKPSTEKMAKPAYKLVQQFIPWVRCSFCVLNNSFPYVRVIQISWNSLIEKISAIISGLTTETKLKIYF